MLYVIRLSQLINIIASIYITYIYKYIKYINHYKNIKHPSNVQFDIKPNAMQGLLNPCAGLFT